MRIDHLHIENFKKFAVQDIDLDPHFTLLVGENGAGKTTFLDALAVAASIWLVKPPDTILINSDRFIDLLDIRLEPLAKGDRTQFQERRPVIVRATGSIDGHDGVSWTRQIRVNQKRTTNADAEEVRALIAKVYTRDAAGENVLCPVLAYYGAGRAWLPSNERVPKAKTNGPARRWAAFYDCFNERIRFPDLNKWFRDETTARGNNEGRWRPGAEAVRRAVLRCVPDADDIWFDGDRDSIVISLSGQAQPFEILSSGQRMMLALIADLAIKCVTQNAFLLPPQSLGPDDEPWPRVLQQTPGLVLIDEADVHLHPAWQRRIAKDLQAAFPSIQFVCTTHSPQVIGEVSRESIRLLSSGKVEIPPVAYGADSNWILEHVMGANQRNEAIAKLIRAVEDAIEEGDLEAAKRQLASLRQVVGGEEGEIARLDSSIRNMEALAHEKD